MHIFYVWRPENTCRHTYFRLINYYYAGEDNKHDELEGGGVSWWQGRRDQSQPPTWVGICSHTSPHCLFFFTTDFFHCSGFLVLFLPGVWASRSTLVSLELMIVYLILVYWLKIRGKHNCVAPTCCWARGLAAGRMCTEPALPLAQSYALLGPHTRSNPIVWNRWEHVISSLRTTDTEPLSAWKLPPRG